MKWEFPEELEFSYDALEPHIDKKTMEIHHQKHHKAYFDNAIKALGGGIPSKSVEDVLLTHVESPVQNNAGGFYNHCLFWKMLSPNSSKEPKGKLKAAIEAKWETFEKFKEEFENVAKARFGSGWAWLAKEKTSEGLEIFSKPNQDHPNIDRYIPILGLDVWEHAYYLNYQNRRPDYVKAFWNVVNWEFCEEQFLSQ